ncbi:DnaJ-domain-containing protein [Glonium stellatum]|uniref:DnaJ-domain-containing protein n=1 Tax=Glonium stellatum TaxID=574774 RepID=A0A8E2ET06_9PEZI|nr:DnaJ-domain-containing protein [Glonium stellatum]
MAPVEIKDDYYDILGVSNTATIEIITSSYRRLALDRHPDKNPNNPGATAAFQLLSCAYQTIKDPDKRRAYDKEWPNIKRTQTAQKEAKRRQEEFAEAERKKAAEDNAKKQKEKCAREERLRHLERLRSKYDGDIFELRRVVRRLEADTKRLQDQDNEELRKERERNSWWAYVTSPFYAPQKETEEEKQTREVERLQRLASKRIKEQDLAEKKAKLQGWEDALKDTNNKIAADKAKEEEEARLQAAKMQEKLRRAKEARRRAEEEAAEEERRKRWEEAQARKQREEAQARKQREEAQARMRQEQAARAAREAREAREAQEAWEEQMRAWRAAEERRKAEEDRKAEERRKTEEKRKQEEKQKAEAEKRARAASWAETARKPPKARNEWFDSEVPYHSPFRGSGPSKTSSACRHEMFWPKLNGSHTCQNCHGIQRRFAFQCPGCNMIACAGCRQSLRGERRRRRRSRDL